ncbi:type II secretion system protein [Rubritalea tangerina]|uniref:Type II secretion system protein n=2 Tax=Rubritalea tangerina TaxID=430798 RepID=A0ABW4Z9D7_9BACT
MKKPNHSRLAKGFSLVELLVVIAIIALLAGASYPAITSMLKKAKIEEGNKMAADIVFAIEQFESKYGYLPYTTGQAPNNYQVIRTDDSDFLKVLMGQDTDINPNNTIFFEADGAKNDVNGIIYSGDGTTPESLVDPWGSPYTIVIDYTGERKIEFGQAGTPFNIYKDKDGSSMTLRSTTAAVASPGPDKVHDDIDDVKSW